MHFTEHTSSVVSLDADKQLLSVCADAVTLGVIKPRLQGVRSTQLGNSLFCYSEDVRGCRASIDERVVFSLLQRRVATG